MRSSLNVLFLLGLNLPGHAQSSGLLLGLRAGERSPVLSDTSTARGYRTLWFAPAQETRSVALVAELPTLVTPRHGGFWRLDVERSCGITQSTMEMEGPFVDLYAEPVWRMLESPRTFRPDGERMDCAAARSKARELRTDSIDPELYAEPCNIRDVNITFASARYISYDTYSAQTEFCSPGRYTSRTLLNVVDTLGERPSLLHSLPPARRVAVTLQWDAARTDCTFEETPDENWGIVRGLGQWITDFASTGPTVCRGEGMAEFNIRERVPASIARSDPDEWGPRLRRVVASLDDYFVSPAGDVVAVRSGSQLTFYSVRGGAVTRLLLRYTLRQNERVIQAEWATGSHVDRWSRELSRYSK